MRLVFCWWQPRKSFNLYYEFSSNLHFVVSQLTFFLLVWRFALACALVFFKKRDRYDKKHFTFLTEKFSNICLFSLFFLQIGIASLWCALKFWKRIRIELNAIFVYTEAILFGFVEKLQNLEQTEMSNDFLHASSHFNF